MKSTIASILVALAIVAGATLLAGGWSAEPAIVPGSNITVENGIQVVAIRAKGGYAPRTSVAKAGMPTMIRFETSGTFDCSSAMRIPSMDIAKNLPPSGTTDIDVGVPATGALQGSCGMGMYPFEVVFER